MRQIAAKIERSMGFNTDKKEQMEVELIEEYFTNNLNRSF